MPSKLIDAYALLAGIGESATGLLLVSAPGFTLGLLGLSPVLAEPVYLRFVGVFVGSVGMAYLYPFLLTAAARARRLAVVLEITTGIRLAVAAFLAVCLWRQLLAWPWITVLATDLSLALLQGVMLCQLGALDEHR